MKYWICVLNLFFFFPAFSQIQVCPANINFASGDLTHWFAYTGNNQQGNGPSAIKQTYDSAVAAPVGTIGASSISEYQLPAVPGIHINTSGGTDTYGGFSKIPTINGYQYNYSIVLGSTSILKSSSPNDPLPGGYIRGISYRINVPPGATTVPYTMTYAYAMVLENGKHNSSQQPLFSATLSTPDSIIRCASPAYYLPTDNNASGNQGADLDTAAALASGFTPSRLPSPNPDPNSREANPPHLYDVWTKGWTEVTFDLSPYRGQQVTLTFEADNCVPGGHFAYAYVALRNTCAGLLISGDPLACVNSNVMYSIPALTGATYQWSVPSTWTIVSGSNTNIITVNAGNQTGFITAKEQNSCANLQATIQVKSTTPSVGGKVSADATVCAGNNSTKLTLNGETGNVLNWISSQDGLTWTAIPDASTTYTAQNLVTTTFFRSVVQSDAVCPADTSTAAIITVDQKSIGGIVSPANTNICIGQTMNEPLVLTGQKGNILNWQSSLNNISWNNIIPQNTSATYNVGAINVSASYRALVKNGVCPADTSSSATVQLFNAQFPQATISPADTSICAGQTTTLHAVISRGTNYNWTNSTSLANQGSGVVASIPDIIDAIASPSQTINYILSVQNIGCPNLLQDTFLVNVIPPFIVSAGNDTSVVVNEPLQLQATSTDILNDSYTWSPASFLNDASVSNPVAIFDAGVTNAAYTVTGIDAAGCSASGTIHIKVYNVPPDLYVPTAFTPNGDGLNDEFKPTLLGMRSLTSFRVYNRWGQIVFSTTTIGKGWDGTMNGTQQSSGNYVWIAIGVNYSGKSVQKQGNVILIR